MVQWEFETNEKTIGEAKTMDIMEREAKLAPLPHPDYLDLGYVL